MTEPALCPHCYTEARESRFGAPCYRCVPMHPFAALDAAIAKALGVSSAAMPAFPGETIAAATIKTAVAMQNVTEQARQFNGALNRLMPYYRKLSAACRRQMDRDARRTMTRRGYRRWRGRAKAARRGGQ